MRFPRALISSLIAASLLVAGCGTAPPPARPEDVRARITELLPASVVDRPGWAIDIYAAFDALRIEPSASNVCAVLAVAEQESTYRTDPLVPGLGKIAREEIDRRAERAGVPQVLVQAALNLRSPDSRTWSERINAARSEKELSDLFQDFISQVPLGQRFFAGYNPVRTGGPMQVSVEFSETQVKTRTYRIEWPDQSATRCSRAAAACTSASLTCSTIRRIAISRSIASPTSTPVSTRVATPRSRTR